jgi:GNAT superfamily N-acetyltransferase
VRKIEPLGKEHERIGFDCGNEALNVFLRQMARQHAERGISRTYVLVEEEAIFPKRILGFFTLCPCEIEANQLPVGEAKRLPREVGGLRLARLAVARDVQRQGLGRELLVAVMRKFMDSFGIEGGIGLFVDAKDLKTRRYYEQFGFIPFDDADLQLFLPLKTIQRSLGIK